jgi:hypothetical protein
VKIEYQPDIQSAVKEYRLEMMQKILLEGTHMQLKYTKDDLLTNYKDSLVFYDL